MQENSMTFANLSSPMQRNAIIMYYALATPGNHVLVGEGHPGIGKTMFTRAVARSLGVDDAHFLRWSVGQHGPEDFNGWPVPRAEGLRFEAPYAVRRINDGKPALWMFDELSLATRTTQGAALRVFDERYCGDDMLNENVKLVGMMNPPESAADGQDIAKPLANRAVWLRFHTPSNEDHVAFEMGATEPTVVFPEFDRAKWDDCKSEVTGIYASFMSTLGNQTQHQGVLAEDITKPDVYSRWPLAFASPRSWTYALKLTATCRMFNDEPAMLELLKGTIGEPQALQFMAFYKNADLVPPKDVIEDPTLFQFSPSRPDRTFAQLNAVARYCVEKRDPKKDIDTWHKGWGFFQHLKDIECPKDLLLPAAQHLGTNKPKGQLNSKYVALINELNPMVLAAGIDASAKLA